MKKKRKVEDFQKGNLKDRVVNPKNHSMPQAGRFTEPDQNASVRQGKPRME